MKTTTPREFVHHHLLDLSWHPPVGSHYRDAPHAVMEVTRVTEFSVYYRRKGAPGNRGVFSLGRKTFEREYPEVLS